MQPKYSLKSNQVAGVLYNTPVLLELPYLQLVRFKTVVEKRYAQISVSESVTKGIGERKKKRVR